MSLKLPQLFQRNIIGAFTGGSAWLTALPALLTECEDRWKIALGAPFELSFNYVVPATAVNGDAFVLKVGVPHPELVSEIHTLRLYAGEGAVRLLDFDEDKGFLLMQRLNPGHPLSSLADDEQATRIAAHTMQKLWRPLSVNHSFPTVEKWADGLKRLRKRFNGGAGPFPIRMVDMAERLFNELLSSAPPPILLHGDLHHLNILLDYDRWIAIDPKGVAGEPAYEVGALLENPNPRLCTDARVQRRRLDVLSEELALDKERMLGYAVAHAVLSAWWSYEDSGDEWEAALACAETLATLHAQLLI